MPIWPNNSLSVSLQMWLKYSARVFSRVWLNAVPVIRKIIILYNFQDQQVQYNYMNSILHILFFFAVALQPNADHDLLIHEVF